jgi:hypothetical protein
VNVTLDDGALAPQFFALIETVYCPGTLNRGVIELPTMSTGSCRVGVMRGSTEVNDALAGSNTSHSLPGAVV